MIEELAKRHRRMLTSPVFWPQLWAPPCILPSISFFICERKGQTPAFDEEEIREQRDTLRFSSFAKWCLYWHRKGKWVFIWQGEESKGASPWPAEDFFSESRATRFQEGRRQKPEWVRNLIFCPWMETETNGTILWWMKMSSWKKITQG